MQNFDRHIHDLNADKPDVEEVIRNLKAGSNITSFRKMFDIVSADKSNALLPYIFTWKTNEDNLCFAIPENDFAKKIKRAVLSGETFSECLGVIKK